MSIAIIITSLLPVAILLFAIYRKDKVSPEPTGQLVKAFGYGVASVLPALALATIAGEAGLYSESDSGFGNGIRTAFFGAAIPEETAKLLMLWLLLRRNRFFDENMDGIVYAVFVSLGFAALENILCLSNYSSNFLSIGISRAFTAIPGHLCFGILMGYYYSLAKFSDNAKNLNKALVWLTPVAAHGVYDGILFISNVPTIISILLSIIFFIFLFWLCKTGRKKIKEHLKRDGIVKN